MGRRKPTIYSNVTFTGIADKGQCVGRTPDGQVVFAPMAAPGDVADVLVKRKKKGFLVGAVTKIHKYSEDRTEPFCEHFSECGGCRWQHITYESQLRHKETVVRDAFQRIAKVEVGEWQPILPAARTTYYRNKLEFTFSDRAWMTKEDLDSGKPRDPSGALGFHLPGRFDHIVDIKHCWLEDEPANALRLAIKAIANEQGLSFYNVRTQQGMMRQMVVRVATTGEVMLIVVFTKNSPKKIGTFLDAVLEQFPDLTTVIYGINDKANDSLYGVEMHTYFGPGYIEEQLGHVRFRIGPNSFFQTNTQQGKALYDTVVEFADLQGHENVYDLYTGLGSIALYVADSCRSIVGIEEIEAAIEDAHVNARLNEINNAQFYAGDVKDILTPEFAQKHGKPDLLITDPPRAGMHAQVVNMLLELAAPRVIYVSCNPATQARDLQLLSEKYKVLKVRPVDMFPQTSHIENVALLELR
jgi:23S rRNA (uracil1939-C5)-methyltransferase